MYLSHIHPPGELCGEITSERTLHFVPFQNEITYCLTIPRIAQDKHKGELLHHGIANLIPAGNAPHNVKNNLQSMIRPFGKD